MDQMMLDKIRQLRLMDDDFMTKVFENDKVCTEIMLWIILDRRDIEVISVQTQKTVNSIEGHSVRLDIVAKDSTGRIFNVEIQRRDRSNEKQRARYYCSVLDTSCLGKGQDYNQLPDVYVIFIMEKDIFGFGEPVYRVEKTLNGKYPYDDGRHILFVNGATDADTSIGALMHDFRCTDPSEMKIPELQTRVKYFKESEEGVNAMCKLLEDMCDETKLTTWIESVKNLMASLTIDKAAAARLLMIPAEYRDTVLAAL